MVDLVAAAAAAAVASAGRTSNLPSTRGGTEQVRVGAHSCRNSWLVPIVLRLIRVGAPPKHPCCICCRSDRGFHAGAFERACPRSASDQCGGGHSSRGSPTPPFRFARDSSMRIGRRPQLQRKHPRSRDCDWFLRPIHPWSFFRTGASRFRDTEDRTTLPCWPSVSRIPGPSGDSDVPRVVRTASARLLRPGTKNPRKADPRAEIGGVAAGTTEAQTGTFRNWTTGCSFS
mmetsp:Transcript_22324/g.52734  ORF Transcript_22324/g.52734 Transcript_22324/m.52734 type:complete len:230 (-) Transcript_22324:78-767(-)